MDETSGKVPNWLVFCGSFLGFLLAVTLPGGHVVSCLAGFFVPFFILYPLYAFRALGGGDIKLFMAVGSILGIKVWNLIAVSFLCGAIYSCALLMKSGQLIKRFNRLYIHVKSCVIQKQYNPYELNTIEKRKFTIPFAVCIYFGYTVLCITRGWQW